MACSRSSGSIPPQASRGAGLGWPPGHLPRILNGESPGPAGTPVAPETQVMARLTQIKRKLDAVLTQLSR
jgi:hypothetical protein